MVWPTAGHGVAQWSGRRSLAGEVGEVSAMGQPTRPTQPSIPPGSVNYMVHKGGDH